jgi:hypothetical protein
MDGTLRILLVIVAATIPAALLHELGRAAIALVLTKGRVCVLLGTGRPLFTLRLGRLLIGPTARWLWGGECLHEAASKRRTTLILLAGPVAGDLTFLAAAAAALTWRSGATDHAALQLALFVFALVALTRASADLVRAHGHRPGRLAVASR